MLKYILTISFAICTINASLQSDPNEITTNFAHSNITSDPISELQDHPLKYFNLFQDLCLNWSRFFQGFFGYHRKSIHHHINNTLKIINTFENHQNNSDDAQICIKENKDFFLILSQQLLADSSCIQPQLLEFINVVKGIPKALFQKSKNSTCFVLFCEEMGMIEITTILSKEALVILKFVYSYFKEIKSCQQDLSSYIESVNYILQNIKMCYA